MANDLVFNMIANSSQFTAGMKQAQKAADSLIVGTMTNLEKFQRELANVQKLKDLGLIDAETTKRAQGALVDQYDPFGIKNQEKMAAEAAAAEKQIANDKAAYIQGVIERSRQMEYAHLKQFNEASLKQKDVQREVAEHQKQVATERAASLKNETVQARQNLSAMISQDFIDSRMDKIVARSKKATQELTVEGTKRGMIIQQLAFAAEDAASQFGTRGLSGALMAAGNNLSFVGSMINPMVGAMTSLGLAAASTSLVMMKINQDQAAAAKSADELAKAQNRVADAFKRVSEVGSMDQVFANRRFDVQDVGRMSADSALSQRRKAERDKEILDIKRHSEVYSAVSVIRSKADEKYNELQLLQNQEYNHDRYNQMMDLVSLKKKSDAELMANDASMLPTGLLNQEEIASLKQRQEEYRKLGIEIESVNAIREAATARIKDQANFDLEAAGADLEWQNYSKMWDEAQGMIEKLKTSEDRYVETLTRINVLKREGLITDEEELKLKNRLNAPSGDVLGGAMDIKSAQAGGLVAETYAKMSLMQQMKVAQATEINVKTTSTPEDQKEKHKQEELLKKILEAMKASGKQFSLEVVGLN